PAAERVFALLGEFPDLISLLEHRLCLLDDLHAERCCPNLVAAALEQRHIEFILELLDGNAQGRLADVAAIGGLAEMAGLMQRNDVTKFGKGHGGGASVKTVSVGQSWG